MSSLMTEKEAKIVTAPWKEPDFSKGWKLLIELEEEANRAKNKDNDIVAHSKLSIHASTVLIYMVKHKDKTGPEYQKLIKKQTDIVDKIQDVANKRVISLKNTTIENYETVISGIRKGVSLQVFKKIKDFLMLLQKASPADAVNGNLRDEQTFLLRSAELAKANLEKGRVTLAELEALDVENAWNDKIRRELMAAEFDAWKEFKEIRTELMDLTSKLKDSEGKIFTLLKSYDATVKECEEAVESLEKATVEAGKNLDSFNKGAGLIDGEIDRLKTMTFPPVGGITVEDRKKVIAELGNIRNTLQAKEIQNIGAFLERLGKQLSEMKKLGSILKAQIPDNSPTIERRFAVSYGVVRRIESSAQVARNRYLASVRLKTEAVGTIKERLAEYEQ